MDSSVISETRDAGSLSIHISDSRMKVSGLQALPTHGPIVINGNANFTTDGEWTSSGGDGTLNNHYVFGNYSITSTGISSISISNTDSYFVIQNVELKGSDNTGVINCNQFSRPITRENDYV